MERFKLIDEQTYANFVDWICEQGYMDKKLIVEVKTRIKKRSLDQNRLLWLYLTCIEKETGNEKTDLHEYFKSKFLQKKKVLDGEISVSTTELNTSEFREYIDKIVIFASSELGITLPNPDDLKFKEFEKHYSNFI